MSVSYCSRWVSIQCKHRATSTSFNEGWSNEFMQLVSVKVKYYIWLQSIDERCFIACLTGIVLSWTWSRVMFVFKLVMIAKSVSGFILVRSVHTLSLRECVWEKIMSSCVCDGVRENWIFIMSTLTYTCRIMQLKKWW